MVQADLIYESGSNDGMNPCYGPDVKALYEGVFAEVQKFVRQNKGTTEDAKDIVQEAFLVFYDKAIYVKFLSSDAVEKFIIATAKNLWWNANKLESIRRANPIDSDMLTFYDNSEDDEEAEKNRLFIHHFNMLERKCRRVLLLFIKETPVKEIARRLGKKTGAEAIKQKYKCKKKLLDQIRKDPRYKELVN